MPRAALPESVRSARRIELVRTRPRPFADDDSGVFSTVGQLRAFRRPITAAELGTVLNRSEDVIYALARKGKIPKLIIPGSKLIQFDPATIVYWLTKHNTVLKDVQRAS